jgi:hypothetical protein
MRPVGAAPLHVDRRTDKQSDTISVVQSFVVVVVVFVVV